MEPLSVPKSPTGDVWHAFVSVVSSRNLLPTRPSLDPPKEADGTIKHSAKKVITFMAKTMLTIDLDFCFVWTGDYRPHSSCGLGMPKAPLFRMGKPPSFAMALFSTALTCVLAVGRKGYSHQFQLMWTTPNTYVKLPCIILPGLDRDIFCLSMVKYGMVGVWYFYKPSCHMYGKYGTRFILNFIGGVNCIREKPTVQITSMAIEVDNNTK